MKRRREDDPRRILVIRLSAMGDVLLVTPLIRMLKNRFPRTEIDFLVKQHFEPLLRYNRHLHRVLTLSPERGFSGFWGILRRIREGGYDRVVDVQVNIRSTLFRFLSGVRERVRCKTNRWKRFLLVRLKLDVYGRGKPIPLRYLDSVSQWGVVDDGLGLELEVEEEVERSLSLDLKRRGMKRGERIVALAPGAGRATKRWLAEGFAEVGCYFGRKGNRVVLVGGEGDQEVCGEVARRMDPPPWDFAGELSLQETAALLSKSEILVSNDTGVMHVGSALGKPVVAIFGPTTHHLGFVPFRTSSIVVEKTLSCRPCSYHGTDKCPKGHFRCMKEIRSMDVIRAVEELLRKE